MPTLSQYYSVICWEDSIGDAYAPLYFYTNNNPIKTEGRMNEDNIRDIAIEIVNKLVGMGLIKDCTDTNDQTEFEAQDEIVEILNNALGGE